MDIRHIDVEISVKKYDGEEEEQNLYKTLFNRRLRISMDFPMVLEDVRFRQFLHDRIDTMLDELRRQMEVM